MARRSVRTVRGAGGVVVRSFDGEPHVLLIKDPYGKWGLPKGHAEDGEVLPETALREVSEETGLADLELGTELVTIDWKFRAEGALVHKFATFFLMFSGSGDPIPERTEGITDALWIPLASAHERVSYPNATVVVRAAQTLLLDQGRAISQTERIHG